MDWRSLGYAAMIEAALLALAAFGGPHGALGAAALVQLGLWYLIVAALRARRRRHDHPAST